MARYKKPDVDQYRIVTLNFSELFPEDHFLSRLLDLIGKFDLNEFDNGYANDTSRGGRPAMPVDRMLAIIIYSLLYGNISMRNLERDLQQRADLMYLSGGLTFDHSLVSIFRKRHEKAIKNLFSQTVFAGVEAGMIDLDTVCIDSTKIKASANRRDIGTADELERRLTKIEEVCAKRFEQWNNSEDQAEKEYLEKKLAGYKRQQEKIKNAIDFLKQNKDRKRIHLTDPDADWHKDGSNHFIVGYSAQTAVDSKNKMIVHQKVVTDQSDSNCTVSMVKAVEEVKNDVMPQKTEPIKYALDCGYASEKNLEELNDLDMYIPDRELAREIGGKVKPEDRKEKSDQLLRFDYIPESDLLRCPEGSLLTFRRVKSLNKIEYRVYRKDGCHKCTKQGICAGNRPRKEVHLPQKNYQAIKHKLVAHYGEANKTRMSPVGGILTIQMRAKLATPDGKKIYSRRFEVVEGVFGIIKEIRNASEFLRRMLPRVQVEWSERCIAHNISRLLEFRRI